jgi:hypothetical protein
MHNRRPEGLISREISWRDGVVLVPLVLCILGLALYPQLVLKRTNASVQETVQATCKPNYDFGFGGFWGDRCPGDQESRSYELTHYASP